MTAQDESKGPGRAVRPAPPPPGHPVQFEGQQVVVSGDIYPHMTRMVRVLWGMTTASTNGRKKAKQVKWCLEHAARLLAELQREVQRRGL